MANLDSIKNNELQEVNGISMDIAKNASALALHAVAHSVGQRFNKEEVESREWVNEELHNENSNTLKVITAAVVKTIADEGIIDDMSSDTPPEVVAGIAEASVENLRIKEKIANKEISVNAGLLYIQRVGTAVIKKVWDCAKNFATANLGLIFPKSMVEKASEFVEQLGKNIAVAADEKLYEKYEQLQPIIVSTAKKLADVAMRGITKVREKVKSIGNKIKARMNEVLS